MCWWWKHSKTVLLQNRCDATQGQACWRFMANATANDVQGTNKISVWFRTKSGDGLNADGGADSPTSAMPVRAHYFIFYFFIQHTGVDILESSHACYCFSTTPRLPGTSSSTSFVLTAQLLFPFQPFFSCKCAKVWATWCFILCRLINWISLISREWWLALFVCGLIACKNHLNHDTLQWRMQAMLSAGEKLVISYYVLCNKASASICDIKLVCCSCALKIMLMHKTAAVTLKSFHFCLAKLCVLFALITWMLPRKSNQNQTWKQPWK